MSNYWLNIDKNTWLIYHCHLMLEQWSWKTIIQWWQTMLRQCWAKILKYEISYFPNWWAILTSPAHRPPPLPLKNGTSPKKKLIAFQKILSKKKIWYNFFFHFGLYHFFWVKKPKSSLLKIERWFLVPVGKIWFQAYTNK